MVKWKISEMGRRSGVTVRTLHHYDKIGLLRATARQINGPRVYQQSDLKILKMVQSLKFLGFKLSTIKGLINHSETTDQQFDLQEKIIDTEIQRLTKVKEIFKETQEELKVL